MHLAAHEIPQLIGEHHALMRHYGQTQRRCDALVRAQAAEIERLQGQAMRLRAAVIVRDTALAWERSQRVDALRIGLQNLAQQRLQWQWSDARAAAERESGVGTPGVATPGVGTPGVVTPMEDPAALAASFAAADLVICQTGCLSHGDYWRVQDHCRRTGQTCVLVEQSVAMQIPGVSATSETAIEWVAAAQTAMS